MWQRPRHTHRQDRSRAVAGTGCCAASPAEVLAPWRYEAKHIMGTPSMDLARHPIKRKGNTFRVGCETPLDRRAALDTFYDANAITMDLKPNYEFVFCNRSFDRSVGQGWVGAIGLTWWQRAEQTWMWV